MAENLSLSYCLFGYWLILLGFGFERWDFVVVFGLILACGHGGG